MVSKSLALLALSSLAIAKPHGHQHQHVPKHIPQGTGPRGPRGTGRPGFFPGGNGTWGDAPFASGSGAGSVPVVTQTVVPVPGEGAPGMPTGAPQVPGGGEGAAPPKPEIPGGDEGAASPPAAGAPGGGQGGISGPPDVNNNIPATDVAGGAGGNACVPQTTTTTTIQYVTVTADAGSPPQGGAPPAGGALPSGGEGDLTNTKDASAGEFFGVPTGGFGGGYGGGHGGQGGDFGGAAQSTTFATLPAGGNAAPTPAGGYGGAPSGTGSPAIPTGGSGSGSGSGSGNSTGGGASGGKAGLSYNSAGLLSAFDGAGMSWAYNWAAKPDGTLPSGVEYVPMCWGANDIDTCAQAAAGAKHVLGFNEPDLGEQADMTPEAAAQGHIKALNPLGAAGAQVGSPSITNGGAPHGIDWLNKWFSACGGQCTVDFVTFHWYDSASNIGYFKQHVQDVIDTAKQNGVSKVWLTEFGVTSGDAASFITEAKAFLDSTPEVERYAYFMAAEGNLIQGGGLSAAGKAYAGSS
ncbi:uncharacterized protein HMPREF1541_05390 [Cyphellophora europaea CBS 101466]|uniref:Asl1-like glycosyl hydrolase catalytic domain-containing protein n=1 Tax=Cyphellophora europaea (strain CBS 101466) TaxID=1220924 RepID=W2RRS6_CYPE1|nr:uncharacterized protein HMPREF1541_05390 [Cyphellophora europaea CBS 101466]ETN39167.1 hypothetical protein HMPREF1541_05390 [Cyphellophora europaea CBS 101466]